MYQTSKEFQEAAFAVNRSLAIKATLKTAEKSWELSGDDIEAGGFSLTDSIMGDEFQLGSVTAKSVSLKLNNRDGRWKEEVLDGATLMPYCGLVLSDGREEYVPMGVFIIDEPSRPYATLTLKGMDRLLLLDEPLRGTAYSGDSAQFLLRAISAYCHIPLSGQISDLGDKTIQMDGEGVEKMTCRDAVSELAVLYGGYAQMNRRGELEIKPFHLLTREEALIMPLGSRKNFTQTCEAITITGMKYQDESWGSDDYPLEIKELNLLPDGNSRVLDQVWESIKGFSYTAYTADYFGNPAIDAGDVVLHQTREGEVLSLVGKHSYVHGGNSKMEAGGKGKCVAGHKSANERRLTQIAAKTQDKLKHALSDYQQATANMTDLIGMMLGVYQTIEHLPDGSMKIYYHDKPRREDSKNIWAFNGEALAFSDDGGASWGGITADQSLVIKVIEAVGINAEWVRLGNQTIQQYIDEEREKQAGKSQEEAEAYTDQLSNILQKQMAQDKQDLLSLFDQNTLSPFDRDALERIKERVSNEKEEILMMAKGGTLSLTDFLSSADYFIEYLSTLVEEAESYGEVDREKLKALYTEFWQLAGKTRRDLMEEQEESRMTLIRDGQMDLEKRIGAYEERARLTTDSLDFYTENQRAASFGKEGTMLYAPGNNDPIVYLTQGGARIVSLRVEGGLSFGNHTAIRMRNDLTIFKWTGGE